MPKYDKCTVIIEKIIRYCEELDTLSKRFGESYKAFSEDFAYQRACAMCILQIGELSSRLPEELRKSYDKVEWAQIRGMRNLFVHDYESVNLVRAWETIEKDYNGSIR